MAESVGNPHIIGLTGSFGSGCTYIADNVLVPNEYEKVSLSRILREFFRETTGRDADERKELQDFGDALRRDNSSDYLASRAISLIANSGTDYKDKRWVVDSIRNPQEVQALRDFTSNFYLIGVYADRDMRWARVNTKNAKYKGGRDAFDRDDQNDTGSGSESYGQRVSDCFHEADIVLRNDAHIETVGNKDFEQFRSVVEWYISLVQKPLTNRQATRNDEAMMAMAYAVSQRSSCPQRKVGAVITDTMGNIISSGFNEVPPGEKPCLEQYLGCFRAKRRKEFFDYLSNTITGFDQHRTVVEKQFKQEFRILDICRALHAEENAIINLARHGRLAAGEDCTLYTTTYPCRLCANKISQLGIRRVVYLEPYPDEEAKIILDERGVRTEFFQGITHRAYFRIYGDRK